MSGRARWSVVHGCCATDSLYTCTSGMADSLDSQVCSHMPRASLYGARLCTHGHVDLSRCQPWPTAYGRPPRFRSGGSALSLVRSVAAPVCFNRRQPLLHLAAVVFGRNAPSRVFCQQQSLPAASVLSHCPCRPQSLSSHIQVGPPHIMFCVVDG